MRSRPVFLLILVLVTLAFGAILWAFHGAVFWGMVLAILFSPLHQRLLRKMPGRANLAALCTLGLCMLIVILPLSFLSLSLVHEATLLYEQIRSGQFSLQHQFNKLIQALPSWLVTLLDQWKLTTFKALQLKLNALAGQLAQLIAGQALILGQNALQFLVSFALMLYMLFFLIRDGHRLLASIANALPLEKKYQKALAAKFSTVIRATVKGNVMVALAQGTLGGIIFWVLDIQAAVLWGAVMAFLSLLPAVGAGLIWMPVALYLLLTGEVGQAVALASFGVGVISLVDNLLRPLLVGKDTQMPDYLVLLSTLGGLSLFGLAGFVVGPMIAALFIACWDLYVADAALAATPSTAPLRDDVDQDTGGPA